MLSSKKIGVVVPAYNVEKKVVDVLSTMPEFVDRIFVVDDKSSDNTAQAAEKLADEKVMVIHHEHNSGVGGAIVTGYKQAVKEGIDVCAVMAGDNQMDPTELESVVQPVVSGDVDYVKGNRFSYGTSWQVMPKYRFIGNATLSLLTKIASGYWKLSDFQTGYTAISLSTLQKLPLKKIYRRYGFPNDILVKCNVINARVLEVPVKPIYNDERSGIRLWKVIPKISWLLIKDFLWRLSEKYLKRDFHPLIFFYFFGAIAFFIGSAFGLYLLIYRIAAGPVSGTSALFAALFFLFGVQSLFFAMWFDMDTNKDLQK